MAWTAALGAAQGKSLLVSLAAESKTEGDATEKAKQELKARGLAVLEKRPVR